MDFTWATHLPCDWMTSQSPTKDPYPTPFMFALFTYILLIFIVNVYTVLYTIHGSYGINILPLFVVKSSTANPEKLSIHGWYGVVNMGFKRLNYLYQAGSEGPRDSPRYISTQQVQRPNHCPFAVRNT